MLKYSLCILRFSLLFWITPCTGQISVLLGYERLDVGRWNLLEGEEGNILRDGINVGISQEFRSKSPEWALVPALFYSRYRHQFLHNTLPATVQMSGPGLQLGIRLYPLHFLLDCEQCNSLKDGLFVSPQLGYQFWQLNFKTTDIEISDQANSLILGLKSGFILRYGERFSVSPVLSYRYIPEVWWDGLGQLQHKHTDHFFQENTPIRFHSIEVRVAYKW